MPPEVGAAVRSRWEPLIDEIHQNEPNLPACRGVYGTESRTVLLSAEVEELVLATPHDARRLEFHEKTLTRRAAIKQQWAGVMAVGFAIALVANGELQLGYVLLGGFFGLVGPLAIVAGVYQYRRAHWPGFLVFHGNGIDVQRRKEHFVLPWSDIEALSITEGDVSPSLRLLVAKPAAHISLVEQDPRDPLGTDGRWKLFVINELQTIREGKPEDASELDIISAIQRTAPARLHDVRGIGLQR